MNPGLSHVNSWHKKKQQNKKVTRKLKIWSCAFQDKNYTLWPTILIHSTRVIAFQNPLSLNQTIIKHHKTYITNAAAESCEPKNQILVKYVDMLFKKWTVDHIGNCKSWKRRNCRRVINKLYAYNNHKNVHDEIDQG